MKFLSKAASIFFLSWSPLLVNAEAGHAESADVAENIVPPVSQQPVPPPPPGPYMSTALVENERFAGHGDTRPDGSVSAMPVSPPFSVEAPWPNQRLPDKWLPDEGYRYAPPEGPNVAPRQHAMPMLNRGREQRPYGPPYPQQARPSTLWQPLPPPAQPMMLSRPPHRDVGKVENATGESRTKSTGYRRSRPLPPPPVGYYSPRPHMNMQRRMSQNMPTPPTGPWLPLDYYGR